MELARELDFGLLLISHDLAIVRHVADTVAVMYLGLIAETAPARELWTTPLHPYSEALIGAVPHADGSGTMPEALPGEVPDPRDRRRDVASTRAAVRLRSLPSEEPALVALAPARSAACWLQRPGARLDVPSIQSASRFASAESRQ